MPNDSSKKNILLTIAARGGSKGIKGKNIRPLLGKPLIAYTIQQALRWGKAKHVVVTTDSKEIADVARAYKAEVPFLRPGYLAEDATAKIPVLKHALMECEKIFKETYDILVDLDPTAPLRTTDDLDRSFEIFLKDRTATVFSVVKAHKSPYFNMVEEDSNGNYVLCKGLKSKVVRRQDSPQVYAMNASIYFYSRDYILKSNDTTTPLSEHSRVHVMDDFSGVDIDREIDFKFVEFLAKEGLVSL